MTVSIIIAVKAYCENLGECVSKCLELDFPDQDYEIIILPDLPFSEQKTYASSKVKIIPTDKVTPPKKRDIGVKHAKGNILAFLDDDAHPDKEWLKEAVNIFKEDENIGCVCGPAVTPGSDSLRQKASGLVYSSFLVSANHAFRYILKSKREVFDFPSCNFLIKKELFNEVGGFDKPFWPGEDTFLCYKILATGKKMIYDPKVLVYHHRRFLFKGHLGQIKNYAFHRGYFAKKYPKNSLHLTYFIPSIFVCGVIAGGLLSFIFTLITIIYSISLGFYLIVIGINAFSLALRGEKTLGERMVLSGLVFSGIILTHFVYGLYFIRGLFAKKMPEE